MTEFTASNGYTLEVGVGSVIVHNRGGDVTHALGKFSIDALRELFRSERDEELGRWRWPEKPEYMVYSFAPNNVRVFRESVGKSLDYMNEGAWPSSPSDYAKAARAYFEAHPEPKPWEDAKPGEVWELTIDDGSEHTVFVHADRTMGGRDGVSAGGAYFDLDDGSNITAAHKVWPEDAS